MSPEQFLKEFGHLAETEEAIPELRQLVVELAVTGRLGTQEADDPPSSELLQAILAEQATRSRGRVPKTAGDLPDLQLPRGWCWAEWGNVVLGIESGWSPQCEEHPRRDGYWGVLKVSAVSWTSFAPEENKELPSRLDPRPEVAVAKGDFLMSRANTEQLVGRSVIVDTDVNRLLMSDKILRCHFLHQETARFTNIYNRSRRVRAHYRTHASGTSSSMKNISRDVVGSVPVAFPPLPEQKRIVEKVDQLMALCDELEARRKQRQAKAVLFNQAALNAVVRASDKSALKSGWSRLQDHFEVLYELPENVNELRRTILQLAVMGKLVKQDPNQGGTDWFRELGVPNPNRKTEPARPNWCIAQIGELFDVGTGSTPTRTDDSYWRGGTVAWTASAATNAEQIAEPSALVTEKAVVDFRLKIHPAGSLVVALYGQGKTRGQVAQLDFDSTVNQACAVIRAPANQDLLVNFTRLTLKKQYFELRELASGGAQPNLNVGKLKATLLSLPPKGEMLAIVEKVDRLSAFCGRLEAHLARHREQGTRLVRAVVESLVA